MNEVNEIISHYENELNDYKNHILPQLNESIISERIPYILPINGLLNFYMLALYLLDNSKTFFTEPAKFPLNLIFTKTATDLVSLHQCLSIGQRVSSSYIIRSIFETYIDLKLIADSDTEFRMKLYEDFMIVSKWNHYNNYKKYIVRLESERKTVELKEAEQNFNTLLKNEDFEAVERKYKNISANYHPKRPYHWAWFIFKDKLKGENPKKNFICEQLGLYSDYLQVYTSTSLAIHNDPLAINLLIKKGYPTPSPNFSKNITEFSGLALSYTVEIFLIIFQLIQSPKYEEIELYLNYMYHKYIK